MNKIVFVQRETEDKLGPMILTSHIKSHGFDAHIIINPYKNIAKIRELKPEFIGISLLTPSLKWTLSACRFLKEQFPQSRIILGGPHPTFFPQVIEEDNVDIICLGEGEKPLLQLLNSYDGTIQSIENTPNLWIKNGQSIKKSAGLCPLLTEEELTQLPPSDRTHYAQYPVLKRNPNKKIWTSRGCPYNCSYCFNAKYKEMYKGLGKMVRQRSVESVISELKELKKFGWECLEIVDDQFVISRDWVLEFSERYAKEINLPFFCSSTANRISPEIVAALKRCGCRAMYFAIESGVEKIRQEVYNKKISDADIYNAADALHSHSIPFLTFNMVGIPDESLEDLYATVRINQEIKTAYPWCSILQPYPSTKMAEIFRQKEGGLHVPSYSYFQTSCISDPTKRKLFSNAQELFAYMIKSNASFEKFVRLVKHPPLKIDILYPLIFYYFYGRGIKQRASIKWSMLFRYWLYSKLSQ
jgi:radical SAM superfamily enzyme YgiQ (UPF0313 family)